MSHYYYDHSYIHTSTDRYELINPVLQGYDMTMSYYCTSVFKEVFQQSLQVSLSQITYNATAAAEIKSVKVFK